MAKNGFWTKKIREIDFLIPRVLLPYTFLNFLPHSVKRYEVRNSLKVGFSGFG